MRSYLNIAIAAAGGRNGIKRDYSLSPSRINRILNSVESQMTGRVNRNVETVLTAIARAESSRMNALMAKLSVAQKKRTVHKRPTVIRRARKTGLANMSGMLAALTLPEQVVGTKRRKPLGIMVKSARFKK